MHESFKMYSKPQIIIIRPTHIPSKESETQIATALEMLRLAKKLDALSKQLTQQTGSLIEIIENQNESGTFILIEDWKQEKHTTKRKRLA